jgi:hypothetical protein
VAEIVYDGNGGAFEVRSGGAQISGMHRSIRGAMDHARSVSSILDDTGNRDALVRALTALGACSPAEAPTLPHDAVRELAREALSSGTLVLVPYVPPRRMIATVHEPPPPPSLSELAPNEPEAVATHTLELHLVDAAGEPVAGEAYRVELPDGRVVEGRLDARGVALLTGIVGTGTCRVNFPSWDRDAWKAM